MNQKIKFSVNIIKKIMYISGIITLLLLSQVLTGWVDKAYAAEEYEGSADWFLAVGNELYLAGEAAEDDNDQIQFYLQALAVYQEGISEFPQDIPLKYNYEFVRQKLDISLSEKGDGEEGDGEEGESGEGEDGEGQDSESSEGETADEGESQDSSSAADEDEDEPDQDAIERILQMLEQQEEQSLKNNQEVTQGNGNGYGW